MPPEYGVRFRLTFREIDTFHRREWCSAQRIRITMIAGGNHSIISMNASPTVFFRRFQNSPTNTNLSLFRANPIAPAGICVTLSPKTLE